MCLLLPVAAKARLLSLVSLAAMAWLCPPALSKEVKLAAVGDVLLARGVGMAIRRHGASYPLAKVAPILRKADLGFFNLECPLSRRGTPTHYRFLFRADPGLAASLKKGGLNVASLANNHTLDYGRTALLDTISALQKAGVRTVGAGATREAAIRPTVVNVKGLKVGFLAYSDIPNFGSFPRTDRPTPAHVHISTLSAEIRAAKSKADVLIVSFHWGNEYWKRPDERQKKLARLAVKSGADLILGHHPHVLQPTETYRGKPIVYSMGGFVWDPKLTEATKGAIYVFSLRKNSARLTDTIPIRVYRCRPTPARQ